MLPSTASVPKNVVRYFCLSQYGPPFDHIRASAGTQRSLELCEYSDVLKELVYILYQDRNSGKRYLGESSWLSNPVCHYIKDSLAKEDMGEPLGLTKL